MQRFRYCDQSQTACSASDAEFLRYFTAKVCGFLWQPTDTATETSLQPKQSTGWSPSHSHVSLAHPYSGFTWMTFTFVSLCLLLSSICWVSSLVIIKMIEEELKVTFFFGLSPAFWDITIGRIGLLFPVAGVSFTLLWNLIRRKHRSCKRHWRNCKRE